MFKNLTSLVAAVALVAGSATEAAAQWTRTSPNCFAWVSGWDLCTGAYDFTGGMNVNDVNGQTFADFLETEQWADATAPNAFDQTFPQPITYTGTLDDGGGLSGWSVSQFEETGTITATGLTGPFILGLKAGNTASFYYFTSYSGPIEFNTIGAGTNKKGMPQGLSGIRVFSVAEDPFIVPEPASISLLAAGLAGLGLSRRRRQQA